MGNICSGTEATKQGALDGIVDNNTTSSSSKDDLSTPLMDGRFATDSDTGGPSGIGASVRSHNTMASAMGSNGSTEHGEMELQQRLFHEEQLRCTTIVQKTNRAMVSVRSTRGSTVYYDQGFAAALSQHLEQTITTPNSSTSGAPQDARTAVRLPPAPYAATSQALYAILAQPEWDGIAWTGHSSHGSATMNAISTVPNDGGDRSTSRRANLVTHMDHVCEQFLNQHIPQKERLFAGAAPILENMLS